MTQAEVPSGYRLIDTLGRGGTAEVVRAHSTALRRDIALKLPLPDGDVTDETPFGLLVSREQTLIGGLRFPGLVRIFDASAEAPEYIVLEICSGPSLDSLGRIDNLPLALNVISAMALGLEYLRGRGIVHGDFKPHNVFLPTDWETCDSGRLFYAKLSDFSLGRKADEDDSVRVGLGTIGYMAPETIVDNRASHASDLFALGVTAYQVLTGVHPFMEGETDPVQINSRCREEEPPPAHELRSDLSEDVSALIASLLAKDERQRPKSAWEVCRALESLGAMYPYRRALQPKHIIDGVTDFESAVDLIAGGEPKVAERLNLIAHRSLPCLRLTLTENHRRGTLTYDGDTFCFQQQRSYWPARLRRAALAGFALAPGDQKRLLIRAAVCGGVDALAELGLPAGVTMSDEDRSIVTLLRPLLRPSTVRRLSGSMAARAESAEQMPLAARLYVQAGNIEKAELCGFQAAVQLTRDHQNDRAYRLTNLIVDLARLKSELFAVRSVLLVRADILKAMGAFGEARTAYNELIALYEGQPPDGHLGLAYRNLGDVYKALQKMDDGVQALEQALGIFKEIGSDLDVSKVQHNLGTLYSTAGDFRAGLRYFRESLHTKRRLQETSGVAKTLNTISVIYGFMGRMSRCIRVQQLSLKLKRELGDAAEIGSSLNNLGYCYYLMGAQGKAIEALTESLEINRRIGSKTEILHNLDSLSSTMIVAGRLKESLRYIREGIEIAAAIDDKPHTGQFNLNLATVLRRMGRLGEAGQTLLKVHSLLESFDDRVLSIKAEIGAASLRLAIGDSEAALKMAQRAEERARELDARPERLNALLVMTRVTDDEAVFEEARNLTADLGLTRELRLITCNSLERMIQRDDESALEANVEALRDVVAESSEDIELARMCAVTAEIALRFDRGEEAQEMIARARSAAASSGLVPERISALILLGRLLAGRGEVERCFASYKEALGLVKTLSESIETPADRQLFQGTRTVQYLVSEIKRLSARFGAKSKGRS